MIKGIDVILHDSVQTGTDSFGAPTYMGFEEVVHNVLVAPATAEAIVDELTVSGRHLEYLLCIPKTDTHVWENRTVEFFGQKWRTFGPAQEWISDMVPGPWNKQIRVERYG